jgi:outer membrane scaffolding protein for murein synthesis (MipA/OmpV family)
MASSSCCLKGLAGLAAVLVSSSAAAADIDAGSSSSSPDLQAGGFVIVAPKYDGSKEYEVTGLPIIVPSGYGIGDDGLIQLRGPDDLRLRAFQLNGFEAGPLVGWRFDRDQNDSARLRGLGDVDGGFVVGGYAAYRTGSFMPFISYHQQVSGDDTGSLIRFGVEAKAPVAYSLSLTTTVGASYANADYMEAYFSVTPAQSAASSAGLPAYEADAGIKDVYFGVTTDVPLARDWSLKLSGRYSRLVGDAADSPIVENENQFYGGLGLTYRFDLLR